MKSMTNYFLPKLSLGHAIARATKAEALTTLQAHSLLSSTYSHIFMFYNLFVQINNAQITGNKCSNGMHKTES